MAIFLGLGVAAVVGLAAITGGGRGTPETGGLTPLAPTGITEPDLSDSVLFIDGEPVTGSDGDTVWIVNNGGTNQPDVGELSSLVPPGLPDPDVSAPVLFVEGEPVSPFTGDSVFDLPDIDSDN